MITVITTNENGSHQRVCLPPAACYQFINSFLAQRAIPSGERFARAYRNGAFIKEYTAHSPVLRFNDPLFSI